MIDLSSEVPAAVELVGLAEHIFSTEPIDTTHSHIAYWHSPKDFKTRLSIEINNICSTLEDNELLLCTNSLVTFGQYGIGNAYELMLPLYDPGKVVDDPFILDFLESFRRYRDYRSLGQALLTV